MSTLLVRRTKWHFNDDEDHSYTEEYTGDYDAQLHNNGCLVVVEMVPDLLSGEKGAKKVKLTAIYNKDQWDSAEIVELPVEK